jgi:hypothetical protein
MTGREETGQEQRLAMLLERVHTIGRNLAVDGVSDQPGFRHSALDGLRTAVNEAFALGAELHGADFTAGAGPDDTCGCGGRITWYDREWLHIANPALTGREHDARPGGGYYDPDNGED